MTALLRCAEGESRRADVEEDMSLRKGIFRAVGTKRGRRRALEKRKIVVNTSKELRMCSNWKVESELQGTLCPLSLSIHSRRPTRPPNGTEDTKDLGTRFWRETKIMNDSSKKSQRQITDYYSYTAFPSRIDSAMRSRHSSTKD